MKTHTLSLCFLIQRLELKVKFPCSILINLRICSIQSLTLENSCKSLSDKTPATTTEEAVFEDPKPLIKDAATIEEKYQKSDVLLQYNSRTHMYLEGKISLVVYLKSSSGKIPAGIATIDLNSLKKNSQINKLEQPILKCPDKQAMVFYSLAMEAKEVGETVQISPYTAKDFMIESGSVRSSLQRINALESPRSMASSENRFEDYLNKQQQGLSMSLKVPDSSLNPKTQFSKRQRQEQQNQSQRAAYRGSFPVSNQQNQKLSHNRETRQQKGSKGEQSLEQRRHRHRSRMNSQSPQRSNSRERSKKKRTQLALPLDKSLIESKIEQFDDSEMQRTRRNFNSKGQQSQLEKSYDSLIKRHDSLKIDHAQVQEKAQKLEQQVRELKDFQEKYEDLLSSYESLNKRSLMKENTLREQIKVTNQKYSESESEKQKLLLEKNDMISEFEQKEMQSRMNFKEKQRSNQQQKFKLNSKIAALEGQIQKHIESQNQLTEKMRQLLDSERILKNDRKALENTVSSQNSKIMTFSNKVNDQKLLQNSINKLENQAENFKKELKLSKKSLQQKERVLQQRLKSLEEKDSHLHVVNQKLKESEHQLKEKTASNRILQREYEALQKKFDKVTKQSDKQIKDLQQKIANLNQQTLNQSKTAEFAFSQSGDVIVSSNLGDDMESKSLFRRGADMNHRNLQLKVSQLNQQVLRLGEQNEVLRRELYEATQSENRLGKDLVSESEEAEKYRNLLHQCELKNQELTFELEEATGKVLLLSGQKKVLEQKVQRLDLNYRQEMESEKSKFKSLEEQSNRRSRRMEEHLLAQIEELQRQLHIVRQQNQEKDEHLNTLQARDSQQSSNSEQTYAMLQIKYRSEVSEYEHLLRIKGNENSHLAQDLEVMRSEINDLRVSEKETRNQLQAKEENLFILKQDLQSMKADYELQKSKLEETQSKSQETFQEYRDQNLKIFFQFFSIINSEQITSIEGSPLKVVKDEQSTPLQKHPDTEIQEYIEESIENKNKYISEMTKQLKKYERESLSSKQLLKQTEKKLNEVKHESEKLKDSSQDTFRAQNQEIASLKEKVQSESKKYEALKHNNRVIAAQLNKVKNQNDTLKVNLQKQNKLSQEQQKKAAEYYREIQNLKKQNSHLSTDQKATVTQLNYKISVLQKEKQAIERRAESQKLEFDKKVNIMGTKLEESHQRLMNLNKQSDMIKGERNHSVKQLQRFKEVLDKERSRFNRQTQNLKNKGQVSHRQLNEKLLEKANEIENAKSQLAKERSANGELSKQKISLQSLVSQKGEELKKLLEQQRNSMEIQAQKRSQKVTLLESQLKIANQKLGFYEKLYKGKGSIMELKSMVHHQEDIIKNLNIAMFNLTASKENRNSNTKAIDLGSIESRLCSEYNQKIITAFSQCKLNILKRLSNFNGPNSEQFKVNQVLEKVSKEFMAVQAVIDHINRAEGLP